MNSTKNDNQAGVVLLPVLALLTLFGTVGLTFTYYAAETQCQQNPTVETRDGTCIRIIGTDRP